VQKIVKAESDNQRLPLHSQVALDASHALDDKHMSGRSLLFGSIVDVCQVHASVCSTYGCIGSLRNTYASLWKTHSMLRYACAVANTCNACNAGDLFTAF
jgi:hypothetical protein